MSGETWTEYAVRGSDWDWRRTFRDFDEAKHIASDYDGKVFGRTVTASPWLPVEDQP